MKCEMIWKIWKQRKLKSEKIWKIWMKSKLNCEMIWKIWKILITPKETSSSPFSSSSSSTYFASSSFPSLPPPPPPPPAMHKYTLFFRIEKNHPGIVFVIDYASRDQIYHFIHLTLTLFSRNTTVRTQTWYTTWSTTQHSLYPKTP